MTHMVVAACVAMVCATALISIRWMFAARISEKKSGDKEAMDKLSAEIKEVSERVGRLEISRVRMG